MVLDVHEVFTVSSENSQLLHACRAASIVHGGSATVVFLVGICVIIQQEVHNDCVAGLTREMEWRPQKLISRINACTLVEQELTHLHVALPCSYVQR